MNGNFDPCNPRAAAAWRLGYASGRCGEPAFARPQCEPEGQAAFQEGYHVGRAEYEAQCGETPGCMTP